MNKLSKKKKVEFLRFCLDVYTKSETELVELYKDKIPDLATADFVKNSGFCLLYTCYFKNLSPWNIDKELPELFRYKPSIFYDFSGYDELKCLNNKSFKLCFILNRYCFLFPKGQNKERIQIIENVLKDLLEES